MAVASAGHMQVYTSLQRDNHASNPPLSFFTGQMPFLLPNQQRQSTEGNLKPTVTEKVESCNNVDTAVSIGTAVASCCTITNSTTGTSASAPRGMIVTVCRYTWTCAVFLRSAQSCFIDRSLDSMLLPQSIDRPTVIRPVVFAGHQLLHDASDFLFTLTVWKTGRARCNTTQLLTTTGHSVGDHHVSEATLE